MAQVPNYNPVPTVSPQAPGLPGVHVDSPVAAFGGATAEATKGLGRTMEHVGDELFARAQALQDLKTESEVNIKVAQHIQQTGELDNKFRLLSGSQPQEKLEEHVQALTELRAANRASLSNPMAQKRFDSETLRRYSYDVVNAGSYAATQFKQYSKKTEAALGDAALDSVLKDPNNEGVWNEYVRTSKGVASQESALDGESVPEADRRFKARLGRGVMIRAGSLAKTNPEQAQKFFESIKDKLNVEDQERIQDTINDRGVRTNAALVTNSLMGGDDTLINRAMRATKAQESAGRYDNVTTTLNKRGQSQSALGAYGIMESNLAPWSKEILGHEVTKEEFLRSPTIQDEIYKGKMSQYITKYGVEGAGQAWLGGEGGVGKTDRSDAFGTTVGAYGQRFSQMVGPQGEVGQEQGLINKFKAAEAMADKLYPPDKDAALNARAREAFKHSVSVSASAQQREFSIKVRDLRNDIGQTMNMQTPAGRGPVSIQEARQLDPRIDDKIEQMGKLDPSYTKAGGKLDQWLRSNANQDVPGTYERTQEYHRWVGSKDDERAAYDANKAFNEGLITRDSRDKINLEQAKSKHSAEVDAKVDAIMHRHTDEMNSIKAFPSRVNKAANARYTQFRGALILEMRAAQDAGTSIKKPEEEDRIIQRLISEEPTGEERMRRAPWYPLGIPIPLTGVPVTAPRWEQRSLDYPIDVGASARAVDNLRPGQVYILNGRKARVPK